MVCMIDFLVKRKLDGGTAQPIVTVNSEELTNWSHSHRGHKGNALPYNDDHFSNSYSSPVERIQTDRTLPLSSTSSQHIFSQSPGLFNNLSTLNHVRTKLLQGFLRAAIATFPLLEVMVQVQAQARQPPPV